MTREEAKLLLYSKYARLTTIPVDVEHSDNCINIIYDHFEQQIAQQEAQLNDYADKIYQQAQRIELLESPKTCSGCAYGDADSCTKLHFVLPHRPELFSCNYYEPKETK